ncbi:MAG: N-acetylmuramoyl-L-alanine amidase [Candidatus Eisenbacteria sp.]|nr:N-acetylmuramoyl-L-alanine amidase [Candidatus Eisenbacteria bacterium]
MKVTGIVVHHTAVPSTTPLKYIRAYHTEKRGFRDIGYHWVLVETCAGWHSQAGRDESEDGAHCRGRNRTHIGVAIGGNYELDPLSLEAKEALADLLVEICVRHDLDPRTDITRHSQHSMTACPGRNVIESWDRIIDAVSERMPLEGAP